ncbi:MAG: glycosyltransferase family 9 protein [Aquificota bacterium]|nr:MAG: glycosyltransferase family 9 protein [Aquificota bacterium]
MDKRALVVRLSSLGDVVLTSAVFDPLVELGYKPYLLTLKPYGELFSDDHRVRVLQVDKAELFKKETLSSLKGFDLYLDLHKNLRTLLLRLKLGGRWLSYNKESIRRRLAVHFKVFVKPYSVVKAYLQTIGYAQGKPKLLVSEERLKLWEERLGSGYVCIAPGARYEKKRYPYFREVVRLLLSEGYRVVLVGDKKDREYTQGWEGENLCGELKLSDIPAVIKKASLFIGNDSGLLHVARAVGTKCIQVYGGTHPTLGFAVEEEEGLYLIRGLPCQPCDLHGKGSCKYKTFPCLNIDPGVVFESALRLLPG